MIDQRQLEVWQAMLNKQYAGQWERLNSVLPAKLEKNLPEVLSLALHSENLIAAVLDLRNPAGCWCTDACFGLPHSSGCSNLQKVLDVNL